MKLQHISEPELEFARGTHVDPRAGIGKYGVYDARLSARRDRILVGAVGTSDNIEALSSWLERCTRVIPGPSTTRQPNLRYPFCGFNRECGFNATLVIEDEITRRLSNSDLRRVMETSRWNRRVAAAVELYYRQIKFLTQNRQVDVVVCVLPTELHDSVSRPQAPLVEETIDVPDEEEAWESNFRRALKARAMHLGKPLQLVVENTLGTAGKGQQDNATKAWNFCTALYYKANQTVPWRLITNKNRPAVCFVGIGFYRSRDKQTIQTSLAQVFDELGNGVILRGTPVRVDRDDRQPHLTKSQAFELLRRALAEYEIALDTVPGRLVIHKSSNYRQEELKGFRDATAEMRIRGVDFVTVMDTDVRLFREGLYPPYRGTHIELDRTNHLLYTRGSVEYYRTYPGLYVPQPIQIRVVESDESPGVICGEILALTKMNWNNTQFDGKYPITIQCARKVGEVMKYLRANDPEPQISYSFYM